MEKIKNRKGAGKKAQMFSADMLFAIVIFVIILIGIIWLGNFLNEKVRYNENRRNMAIMASYAVSGLIETYGSPADWQNLSDEGFNETNVLSLGLADEDKGRWELDYEKLERLGELGPQKYDTLKKLLGLRGADYEFQLLISAENLTQISVGLEPELNSSNIIVSQRKALLNSSIANITLFLWERCWRGCT